MRPDIHEAGWPDLLEVGEGVTVRLRGGQPKRHHEMAGQPHLTLERGVSKLSPCPCCDTGQKGVSGSPVTTE